MTPETEIEQLDLELAGLKKRYGQIMRESMDDRGIEIRDESLRREAIHLWRRIGELQQRSTALKYSLLSDDEKNGARQDQIALATKFSDEEPNEQRLIYMKYYLELLRQAKHLAETSLEKRHEYQELYAYLNGQDFRYSLGARFDSFCANDPLLRQLYLDLKGSFQMMPRDQALELAVAYQNRHGLSTKIDSLTRAVFYHSFEQVDGPAWIIEAALPPSSFEGTGSLTYIVSAKEQCVKFIINASGFIKYPHEGAPGFSDDELQELKEAGFNIVE